MSSYTRLIYLEFIDELVNYVSKKYFCINFLDSYYLLSKDKCSNVLIKFCKISPNIFKKVSFEDSKNKDRIINILKGMSERDNVGPNVKEFVEQSYKQILDNLHLTTAQKQIREEEEKKFLAQEKEICMKEKSDVIKERRR